MAGRTTDSAHDGSPEEPRAAPEPRGLVDHVPAVSRWNESVAPRERYRWLPRPERWRWLFLGERADPPVAAANPLRDPDPERIGICCSGGGIRSASFNLGVLQALQEHGRLQEAEYLASVSGGSYIAAGVAMVAKTYEGDPAGSPGDDSDPELVTPAAPPFGRGSPEEQYLRNRVSYLAPTGSAKAFLAWRVLLGLLINLALIGAVLTVFAAILAIYYREQDPGLIRPPPEGAVVGATPDGWVWGLGLGLSAFALMMGVFSVLFRPLGRRREGFRRFLEVWSLFIFLLGLVIFLLELVVPQLIDVLRDNNTTEVEAKNRVGVGISASVAGILAAIVVQLRARIADPGKAIEEATKWQAKLGPRARLAFVYVATWVLGPLLLFTMLVATTMVQLESTNRWVQIGVPLTALVILIGFTRFADLNSWSLHPFYRQRLCTAFALRRIKGSGNPASGHAEPRREGELVPLSMTRVVPHQPPFDSTTWPTLLVCAAANLSDPGASPPGRGVTSFTFSADEIGGPLVGGVKTKEFEDALTPKRTRDFTLPATVAMSGAAISPSMGKFTRPSLRFLLALANVRTGVWVPNPRRMESFVALRGALRRQAKARQPELGRLRGLLERLRANVLPTSWFSADERAEAMTDALEQDGKKRYLMPRPSPRYLAKELLGWNSVNDKFLYISDGGHYENLGLVELLRRGCMRIYCFDASGGKQLGTLGDAIALARSELGVEIAFDDGSLDELMEDKDGLAKHSCATGTVRFTRTSAGHPLTSDQVSGRIIYVPTVMTSDLPWDVHAFKAKDPSFPHHSTLNQLFTDQKFEAYRVLGYHAAANAIDAMDGHSVPPDSESNRRSSGASVAEEADGDIPGEHTSPDK